MSTRVFVKHDAKKPKFSLIVPEFLEGLANVLTYGAEIYPSADNWKSCPQPFDRYYSALQRHLNAYAGGEERDRESGFHHLYHAACCLMFLSWFIKHKEQAEVAEALDELVQTSEPYSGYIEDERTPEPHPQGPQMMAYRPLPHAGGG